MSKKSIKRAMAYVLTACMIFLANTGFVSADSDIKGTNSMRIQEVISLRETNSKTYQLSDGSYQYVGYTEDIHYLDADGNLQEINNTITNNTKKDSYLYTNKANSWHAYFSDKLTDTSAVLMTRDNYQISFSTPNDRDNSKISSIVDTRLSEDSRTIIYNNVFHDVDVSYTIQANVLKESIILKSASATSSYAFDINLQGISLEENDGNLLFCNSNGNSIFHLAPLHMEDANGKYSEAVSYRVESLGDKYRLIISADESFINYPTTVYPVVIESSIVVTGSSNTFDTCVDQQYPTSNYYLSENLWTGGALGTNAMRTYIKFDLPTNISASQITSSYLRIKKREHATPTIKAYRVTSSWTSSAITWNNKPGYTSTGATGTISFDTGLWYKINVTDMVKNWRGGAYSNYGFVLKEPTENNSNQKTKFYSSDAPSPNKPELVINYTNPSTYYGTRPYQATSKTNINCMGYALEYEGFISSDTSLGISETAMEGKTTAQMQTYIAGKVETWMANNLGTANYAPISTYNSSINTGWYRVVLRVGFIDDNNNNVYNKGEKFDFHWWYQTNTGDWAEKFSSSPSQYRAGTAGENPTAYTWKGENNIYYNSTGKFYQIKDLRDISW